MAPRIEAAGRAGRVEAAAPGHRTQEATPCSGSRSAPDSRRSGRTWRSCFSGRSSRPGRHGCLRAGEARRPAPARADPHAPADSDLLAAADDRGADGPGGGALPNVPLSPAAERLVASALLLVAWGMSGLPPFHRQIAGALSAPAAALLLYRIGAGALPDGTRLLADDRVPGPGRRALAVGVSRSGRTRRSGGRAPRTSRVSIRDGIRGGCLLLARPSGSKCCSRSDAVARWRVVLVILAVVRRDRGADGNASRRGRLRRARGDRRGCGPRDSGLQSAVGIFGATRGK